MSYTLKQKCKATKVYSYGGTQYTFIKDQEVVVPDAAAAAFFLSQSAKNRRNQPMVKIVIAGSLEDNLWDSIVNDENNDELDYDFIHPEMLYPSNEGS